MTERRYTPTGPGSAAAPSGRGGGRRVAGCALGCLGVLVGGVALLALMWAWVSSPGPQVATEPIVPEDAVAALRIEARGDQRIEPLIHAGRVERLDE